MNKSIGNASFKLAAVLGIFTASQIPSLAMAFDSSGLGPPLECGQYQIKSKMIFEGGKALSADSAEYDFSVLMSEGASGGDCGAPVGSYTAKIKARWDGKTKRAYETIRHAAPATGKVTEVVSSCPENPWTATSNPSCAMVSVTADASKMYVPAIAGPYPVTAYYIGYVGRQTIGKTVNWVGSSDFILPPTTAPQIVAYDDGMDIDGRFYKRNQDVKASVRRPSDGSPEWYTKNLKSYDVEVEVKTAGSSKLSTGWSGKPIVSNVSSDAPTFTLPYARLFDDPEINWSIENFGARGDYRTVRVRARIHDNTIVRPWSSWRGFEVEVPLRMVKAPSSIAPKLPDAGSMGKSSGALLPPAPAPVKPMNQPAAPGIKIQPKLGPAQ